MYPDKRYRIWARSWAVAIAMTLVLLGSTPLLAALGAQQNQKNSKDQNKKTQETGIASLMPLPDTQAIELMVSQMLAAWQIGEIELLHSFYADDVLVVSGAWEQPLQGWQNYLRAYQAQRSRTQGGRLDRINSYTKVQGDTAWCTYQWEFNGEVDGTQSNAVGHTSLGLQKRAGKWIIVLNHTSIAPAPPRPASAVPPGSQPGARPTAPGA